jgi:hypothetical protein
MTKRRRDPLAEAFGTHDWANDEPDGPSTVRERAINELERRIPQGLIPPIGDREPLKDDIWTDEWVTEWHGSPSAGPSIPEMQRLRGEWGEQIDDRINQRNAYQPPEALAETLWGEFKVAYPHHVANPAKVQQAAKQVFAEGGLNYSDRADFYERVARKLDEHE